MFTSLLLHIKHVLNAKAAYFTGDSVKTSPEFYSQEYQAHRFLQLENLQLLQCLSTLWRLQSILVLKWITKVEKLQISKYYQSSTSRIINTDSGNIQLV